MDSAQSLRQRQLRTLESNCISITQRLPQATTMRHVQSLCHVIVRPELRCLSECRQVTQRLDQAGQKRMDALLDAQLKALDGCATSAELKAMRGRFMHHEWPHLRGKFASICRRAETESGRLLYLREQQEKKALACTTAPAI